MEGRFFSFRESGSIRPEATGHGGHGPRTTAGRFPARGRGANLAAAPAIFHIESSCPGTGAFVSAVQANSFLGEKTHVLVTVIQAADFTESIADLSVMEVRSEVRPLCSPGQALVWIPLAFGFLLSSRSPPDTHFPKKEKFRSSV